MMDGTGATGLSVRCYCAAVSIAASAAPKSVVNCHCGQCRRLSGAAFSTWVSFPRSALAVTGREPLSAFQATANVRRHFCRNCGSHVFTEDLRLPQILGVPAGALEGQPPPPSAHYFVDDKAAWHGLCDDLPRFGGESGMVPATTPRDSR
ncbi:GFA family protein [Pelomonas aquatica]|jgi:hypothetical protein|uniref:GFA family protein n=2 Tax=Pelomonas aquatica TaxID=431058 RepID=A0A9X4LJP7_9BURK|nr:GFA family protein [Pelomonas aquatica]MCY4752939.1 GFA family protein [Pelomonas aquatica]MDG0862120.1 GFA family protein [Pelomonas aquatica]